MTTVVINQPGYFPALHFFEQIQRADVFVFYDDVQYTRSDWRNRNRIKKPRGWQWITVPVKNRMGQKINEAKIDNTSKWQLVHARVIEANYSKAPYFHSYWEELKPAFSKKWELLIDLDMFLITKICRILNIDHHFEMASSLGISGGKTERLVNICRHFNADTYYSPGKSKSYLDVDQFNQAGIDVEFQNYVHPTYPQLYGDFIPYMSVIDLLLNCGEKSIERLIPI